MFITPKFKTRVVSQMNSTDLFLGLLRDVLVNPIVCGGAPRDWFFNTTAKDIDIFVDPQEVTPIVDKLSSLNITDVDVKTSEELPENYRSDYISCVISVKHLNIKYQIIVKETTEDPLLKFPCSLSLIIYKDFNLQPHDQFLYSLKNSLLIFRKDCNQKYERKMISYFPNYTIRYKTNIITLVSIWDDRHF